LVGGSSYGVGLSSIAISTGAADPAGRRPVSETRAGAVVALGRPIGELDNPDALALEVHQAVNLNGCLGAALAVLSSYLSRPYDQ